MANFITKNLNQTATYWAPSSGSGWGGKTFVAPAEISVRWSDNQEEFIDPQGRTQLSHAIVHLGQDVELGGYLYLGSSSETNPGDADGAREIRKFAKIPNIKATDYVRKVWL